jgi:hypothetical protein
MIAARNFKKCKKTTVQLTSLLDLLFVMIFVSLIQQKTAPVKTTPKPSPKPVVVKTVVKKVEKQKLAQLPKLKQFSLSAEFTFYATATNPNVPRGSYTMRGEYDEKTRDFKLFGIRWIDRPDGYVMTPIVGNLQTGDTQIKGKIDFPQCQIFTINKTANGDSNPISGTWEGTYDCGQGITGLTLKIK